MLHGNYTARPERRRSQGPDDVAAPRNWATPTARHTPDMATRVPNQVVAAATAVVGAVVAIALPMYTFKDGYVFEDLSDTPGGGPTCFIS